MRVLVNYGGDLGVTAPRCDGNGWRVGLEDPMRVQASEQADGGFRQMELLRGAVATSGNTRRFMLHEGRRCGHILDPRSGWPVADAPHSVTVVAATCTEAGIMATLAMLQGADAESFLQEQGLRYWCLR